VNFLSVRLRRPQCSVHHCCGTGSSGGWEVLAISESSVCVYVYVYVCVCVCVCVCASCSFSCSGVRVRVLGASLLLWMHLTSWSDVTM
jgi:hypothetical protein